MDNQLRQELRRSIDAIVVTMPRSAAELRAESRGDSRDRASERSV